MTPDTLVSWKRDYPHIAKLNQLKRLAITTRLSELRVGDFSDLGHLEELCLAPELDEMAGESARGERLLPAGLFEGLPNLRHLVIFQKGLTALQPDAFRGLRHLESLNLQGNHIRRISTGAFRGLSSLTTLVLDHNRLVKLGPDEFRDLPALSQLSAVGNGIREIVGGTFSANPILSVLNLQHNRLSQVDEAVLGAVGTVALQATGNPLSVLARQRLAEEGCRLHAV